jgi:hypothetical protein
MGILYMKLIDIMILGYLNMFGLRFLSLFLFCTLCISGLEVRATQAYMDQYNANAYAKGAYKGNCALCHNSSSGGDSRNSFGEDFESAGKTFSKKFVTGHPEYFNIPEGGLLAAVNWLVTVANLTPTTNGSLSISLNSIPKNLSNGSHLDYKISASKDVLRYLSFSKTLGTINITDASNISADQIIITPTTKLASPAIAKKLAKKPLKFSVLLIPYESDAKTLVRAEQSKQVIQVNPATP